MVTNTFSLPGNLSSSGESVSVGAHGGDFIICSRLIRIVGLSISKIGLNLPIWARQDLNKLRRDPAASAGDQEHSQHCRLPWLVSPKMLLDNSPRIPDSQLLTQSGKADNLIIRFMKKTSITVTEASRNFADCVNRAHYQNVTFVLLKNGEPVARLVPDNEKVCVGRDLAEALAKTDLPENEARAWHRDLEAARKSLKAPADKWR